MMTTHARARALAAPKPPPSPPPSPLAGTIYAALSSQRSPAGCVSHSNHGNVSASSQHIKRGAQRVTDSARVTAAAATGVRGAPP